MSRTDKLTEEFRTKYERFFIGCDAIEEEGLWNKEENGEMEGFYQNDLLSVILRLIAADGIISGKETEYLNRNFGFSYTTEELEEVYNSCKENIGRSFDETFENGITLLRSVNRKLAEAYKELLGLICDIIIECDGETAPKEVIEARRLKSLFS